jgi:cytidyltransferase-like protein
MVYVDVVCDLFHAGHVNFLRQARSLGDGLIAGIHNDDAVATYKPRPIMTMDERATVLESCRLVDRVVRDAPLYCTRAFLDSVGADFACHGDDFPPDELAHWYADLVGTDRLKVLPYTPGISSRQIIERVACRLKDGTLRIQL